MNEKGFTLVELVGVVVLIAVVSMLTFPALSNLRKNNNEKEFKTYEDMMVEYARSVPNYRSKTNICLNQLGIKKINDNMTCNGYVKVTNNNLKAYLTCSQAGKTMYTTSGYSLPSGC